MRIESNSQTTGGEVLWDKRFVAKFLGISTKTLDRWMSKGRGPRGRKVGVQVRFLPVDVHAYLESCTAVGGGQRLATGPAPAPAAQVGA